MPQLLIAAVCVGLLLSPATFGHDGPDRILTDSQTIAKAQEILLADGYLERDKYKAGTRDRATIRALRAFQSDHRLPPTGFLDWETMSELTSHEETLVDSDGDGVPDRFDKCPDTSKGAMVDRDGCPKDGDGDGVYDGLDRCPDTPQGARVDANGCPTDSDGDGVYDGLDRCPDTPQGAKVDASGCPTDSDGDGVYDGLDRCPRTPKGDKVDAQGCSLPPPPMAVQQPLILEGVGFETNSATLTSGSLSVLDRVAAKLAGAPEVRVEVGGHTDSTGKAAYNLELSKRRAGSVRNYLVEKGIDPSRIEVKGYGQTAPIADNATREGRARNRRVELNRIN